MPLQRRQAAFGSTLSPRDWKRESVGAQALEEEEHNTDLTLVAEGDIHSPNNLLLPPSPLPLTRSPDRPRLHREDAYQDGWVQPGTSPV